MIYLDYEAARLRYERARGVVNEILTEQEELFRMTQPGAIRYDKEKVDGGSAPDMFEKYLSKKAELKIDERLDEAREICDGRRHEMKELEDELRASKDARDRIYLLRYVEHVRVYKIASSVHFSEAHVYRILRKIDKMIENVR